MSPSLLFKAAFNWSFNAGVRSFSDFNFLIRFSSSASFFSEPSLFSGLFCDGEERDVPIFDSSATLCLVSAAAFSVVEGAVVLDDTGLETATEDATVDRSVARGSSKVGKDP